jgi:hypothetical protein
MVVTVEDTVGGLKFSYGGALSINASNSFSGNTSTILNDGFDFFRSWKGRYAFVDLSRSFSSSSTGGFFAVRFTENTITTPAATGDTFGVQTNGSNSMILYLPDTYSSGDDIIGSATFPTATIANTGFQNQVFTFTAGAGSLAGETITFQAAAVPEPSTWALGAFALACGGWQLTRRRRALRVKA